ncbi:MAG: hypothetical protein ACD_75C01235G0001, partial [uncultured bacterium]
MLAGASCVHWLPTIISLCIAGAGKLISGSKALNDQPGYLHLRMLNKRRRSWRLGP